MWYVIKIIVIAATEYVACVYGGADKAALVA